MSPNHPQPSNGAIFLHFASFSRGASKFFKNQTVIMTDFLASLMLQEIGFVSTI
jgi:hypothetical protein